MKELIGVTFETCNNGNTCVICNDEAEYEISNDGELRPFWKYSPYDGEITLCKHCAKEILNKMKIVLDN